MVDLERAEQMVDVRDNKRQVPGSASLGGPVSDQDKLLRPQGIFTVLAYGNYIILNDSSAAQASATFSPPRGRTSDGSVALLVPGEGKSQPGLQRQANHKSSAAASFVEA